MCVCPTTHCNIIYLLQLEYHMAPYTKYMVYCNAVRTCTSQGRTQRFLRDRAPARPLLQEAMGRVSYRHNWVRNALAASLNRMPGIQAVLEPRVMTRRAPGDQRHGDIKVIKSGASWILDVGIGLTTPRQQGR